MAEWDVDARVDGVEAAMSSSGARDAVPEYPAAETLCERPWITFAVLAVAASSFALLQSLIVPVLATIQDEFDTSQSTVTWVLTAYLLSASICTPIVGRLGDVFGKTRMLVAALGVLAVGSLFAALAPSIGWLVAARALQGAGGGVLPLSFGIIRDEFEEGMATALSVMASLTAVGFGVGIVVAGPIVSAMGYHGLFWLPMCVTVVAALAAFVFVPESPVRTPARLPFVPAVFLAGWLVALLLGLSMGSRQGWGTPLVVGLFAVAVLLLAVWILVEQRVPVPMIDMGMMRRRGVWTSNVVSGAMGFGVFASFAFLPQLLQTPPSAGYGFGATIGESGRLLLPWAVASFAVGFVAAPLVRRLGSRVVVTTGMVVTGVAFASMGMFHDSTGQLYAASTVLGMGAGLVFSSLAGVVVASVPAEQTGVASGMNANIRTIGGAIGTAVMAGIVTSQTGSSGYPAEHGYQVGFFVLTGVTLLASLVALRIPEYRGSPRRTALADAADGELGLIPAAGAVPPSDLAQGVRSRGPRRSRQ